MATKWSPYGILDVASDPSELEVAIDGKSAASGAMVRCTNLHLDQAGVARTRRGSSKVSETALSTPVWKIMELAGVRYEFAGANVYRNESSLGVVTSARWSAVKYAAYNATDRSIFAVNGTDRKRIVGTTLAEWGIDAPTTALTLGNPVMYLHDWEKTYHGGTTRFGTEDGSYTVVHDWEVGMGTELAATASADKNMYLFETATLYSDSSLLGICYTFCRKDGTTLECESNPSDEVYVEVAGGKSVTWAAPSDSQITHVRLYRTLIDGTTFYYANEYAIADLSGGITMDDEALGAEVSTDHDRIPEGATVVAGPDFGGTLFASVGNLLYFSKPNQPEYWPSTYYVEVGPTGDNIKSIRILAGQTYCQTQMDIYLIQGTGASSFFPLRQSASVGTLSDDMVLGVKGVGLLHFYYDGLWLYSGAVDSNVTNTRFRPVFQGETKGSILGMDSTYAANAWIVQWHSKIYLGFPGSGETYPGQVLVFDASAQKAVHYDYGRDFSCIAVDEYNDRLLAGDSSGYVWILESSTATDDDGTDISWQVESMEFSDPLRMYFPRYAKWDVDGSGTAYILLEGTSVQSHTLAARNTNKRLVATSCGKRLQLRIMGTGTATVYSAEVE